MEESQKTISIQQQQQIIAPNLLLNLSQNYRIKNKLYTNSHNYYDNNKRSYFIIVQKFKQKEKERAQQERKKNGFVQKFYKRLKKDLQNSTDQKSLKQNLSLMNICLNHKHSRQLSQTFHAPNPSKRAMTSHKQHTPHSTANSLPYSIRTQQHFQPTTTSSMFQQRTNSIINLCQQQNQDLIGVHKKMGLFKYYNSKLSRKFNSSQLKMKKTDFQY